MSNFRWQTSPTGNGKTPAIPESVQAAEDPGTSRPGNVGLFAGLGAGLVALLLLAWALWPKTPACTDAAAWLTTITTMERNGQYDLAARAAQSALTSLTLCSSAKQVGISLLGPSARGEGQKTCRTYAYVLRADLEHSMVNDSLAALLTLLPYNSHDAASQQIARDRYQQIRTSAASYGVALPLTDRQIATAAYRSGEFLVTKAALDEVVRSGQAVLSDRDFLRLYASTTYNAGVILSRWGTGRRHTEGLALLALSDQVSRCWQVGSDEAAAELTRQLAHSITAWPAPAASPLLALCGIQL